MARKSKKSIEIEAKALKIRQFESERIKEIVLGSSLQTTALNPLLDLYLDACEVYAVKFEEWKSKGYPATQRYTNKAGATNHSKHPLAQQVEVWADKKAKLLNQMGLDSKNTKLPRTGVILSEHLKNKEKEEKPIMNKLVKFQQKKG